MSKNAVDVAMVGIAVGGAAIGGVGIASPFWGFAFALGAGVAAGTIALVSQRYGAEAWEELGIAVRSSVVLTVVITLPLVIVFFTFPETILRVISSDEAVIKQGSIYLRYISLGIPFAALNLIGSRTLVGADDAYTEMVLRAIGALANIVLNGILIFGLGMGVMGAAVGTVLANMLVTGGFAFGLVVGWVPLVGNFPVTIDPRGTWIDTQMMWDLISIGLPVIGRTMVWSVAELPMYGLLDIFGQEVLSAYVIARRIWGLMNTPGWGFGLASSSLVGQELGVGNEGEAEAYGEEILRLSIGVYLIAAILIALFAEQIVWLFIDDPGEVDLTVAINLLYVACFVLILQAVGVVSAGALDGSGDTRWTFGAQVVGMFGVAIPLVYLGTVTPLGIWGLYLSFLGESAVPAALNYYRFRTGKWKLISRSYRPEMAD